MTEHGSIINECLHFLEEEDRSDGVVRLTLTHHVALLQVGVTAEEVEDMYHTIKHDIREED